MNAFEHTLLLLKLYHPLGVREAVFLHTPALNALPSRAYSNGRLVRENGVWTSAYMQQKYGANSIESLLDE